MKVKPCEKDLFVYNMANLNDKKVCVLSERTFI